MKTNRTRSLRPIGLAAVSAFAIGLGTAGAAAVAPAALAATPAVPNAAVVNNTLTITGTRQADDISVVVSPTDPSSVVVQFGADPSLDQTFAVSSFATIDANLGAGDDHFTEDLNLLAPAVVDAGSGNDTINTSKGNDVVFGESGNDTINTSDGNDVIFGGAGNDTVNPGKGADSVSLDAGRDSVVWNPGDGSDNIDGGAGRDTMVFNGSDANEVMHLSANGSHAVLTRDVGTITMDTVGVEVVDVAARGGADTVTVDDLSGTSLRTANIDLSSSLGTGDGATDTVIVNALAANDHPRIVQSARGVTVAGLQPVTNISGGETTDVLQVNTSASAAAAASQPMSSTSQL